MIPLVYDKIGHPNVYIPKFTAYYKKDIHHSNKFNVHMPWTIQALENDIEIYTPQDIPKLDNFIYPIMIGEPYYVARSIGGADHPDWGMWAHIDERVIEALRRKKGWIFMDITNEPIMSSDLSSIVNQLGGTNSDAVHYTEMEVLNFPNDRIVINTINQQFSEHPRVFNLPGWLELNYGLRDNFYVDNYNISNFFKHPHWEKGEDDEAFDFQDENDPVVVNAEFLHDANIAISTLTLDEKRVFSLFNLRYNKHIGSTLLLPFLDKTGLFKKGFISANNKGATFDTALNSVVERHKFDVSSVKSLSKDFIDNCFHILGIDKVMPQVKFNIVVEAYYTNSFFDYPVITEKTWRNIRHRKPFIIVGQANSLSYIKNLGYKTFHPYIDETYDTTTDDEERLKRIFHQIYKLCNLSDSEWDDLQKNLQPIFDHNEQVIVSRLSEIKNAFSKLLST